MEKLTTFKGLSFNGEDVVFEGVCIEIIAEGVRESKHPIKFKALLEGTDQIITVMSWYYEDIDIVKKSYEESMILNITAITKTYNGIGEVRTTKNMELLGKSESYTKPANNDSNNSVKDEIREYIAKISNPNMRMLVSRLIDNDDFYIWTAARTVHHNYPGGLAFHSLSVCKRAVASNVFGDMDNDLLIAGSLIHDVGKIRTYLQDSTGLTVEGKLLNHIAIGYELLCDTARELGITNEPFMLLLKHILLAHHEKLEWGSPVNPQIKEALAIARADAMDADYEAVTRALQHVQPGYFSDKVYTVNGQSFMNTNQ